MLETGWLTQSSWRGDASQSRNPQVVLYVGFQKVPEGRILIIGSVKSKHRCWGSPLLWSWLKARPPRSWWTLVQLYGRKEWLDVPWIGGGKVLWLKILWGDKRTFGYWQVTLGVSMSSTSGHGEQDPDDEVATRDSHLQPEIVLMSQKLGSGLNK